MTLDRMGAGKLNVDGWGVEFEIRIRTTEQVSGRYGGLDIAILERGKALARIVGIFCFEGDRLLVCVSGPGKERPTRFATKPGDGWFLLALKVHVH